MSAGARRTRFDRRLCGNAPQTKGRSLSAIGARIREHLARHGAASAGRKTDTKLPQGADTFAENCLRPLQPPHSKMICDKKETGHVLTKSLAHGLSDVKAGRRKQSERKPGWHARHRIISLLCDSDVWSRTFCCRISESGSAGFIAHPISKITYRRTGFPHSSTAAEWAIHRALLQAFKYLLPLMMDLKPPRIRDAHPISAVRCTPWGEAPKASSLRVPRDARSGNGIHADSARAGGCEAPSRCRNDQNVEGRVLAGAERLFVRYLAAARNAMCCSASQRSSRSSS